MEKHLEQNSYKFEFFNKFPQKKDSTLSKSLLIFFGIILTIFVAGKIMDAYRFDFQLKNHINQRAIISDTSAKSFTDLFANLSQKKWTTAQYNLLSLRKLNSTQIDNKVLIALTDYSNYNFKQTYSNEFALLTTGYLTSMQANPSNEKTSLKNLNEILGASWGSNLSKMQATFKQENTLYNENLKEIKENAIYLIKGLKDTAIQDKLIESVSVM